MSTAEPMAVEAEAQRSPPQDLAAANLVPLFSSDDIKVLLLDYDGTLRAFEDDPARATPGPELLELLAKLHARADLKVVIISGRTAAFLEEHLGHLKNYTFVAEHGYQVRQADHEEWENAAMTPLSQSKIWRQTVNSALISTKVDAILGTFMEEKMKSMVWHYRTAQEEEGNAGAVALIQELVANKFPQDRITHGNKMVEIFGPKVTTKGSTMHELLKEFKMLWPSLKTVLCAGDDVTDETMFRVIVPGINILSVKIGQGPTCARYRTANTETLLQFLRTI